MSLIYLVMKLYPVFGISLAFLFFDLGKSLRRKGSRGWFGMLVFSVVFLASAIGWGVLRGDKNADAWFTQFNYWLQHG